MTNSSLPQQPKTSANWLRSFLQRRNLKQPDRKGVRNGGGTGVTTGMMILRARTRVDLDAEEIAVAAVPTTDADMGKKVNVGARPEDLVRTEGPA